MKDLPNSKLDETKAFIKCLNPDKTIFYFDKQYHSLKNNGLAEIPADEAEQCLNSPEYDLINLGNPPGPLPERCPSWLCTNIYLRGPIEEFLQILFDAKFYMNLGDMCIDKTISTN